LNPIPVALAKVTDISAEILAQLSEILETLTKVDEAG
jgi:hypothetical protein